MIGHATVPYRHGLDIVTVSKCSMPDHSECHNIVRCLLLNGQPGRLERVSCGLRLSPQLFFDNSGEASRTSEMRSSQ